MTELDDDREAIEQDMQDQDAGDPAAAFDALRRTIETQGAQIGAEMTVMRRGLEAAFDQLDKIGPPQDYKPELAQLVQQLAGVGERLHGVEQSPILRQGAQHYAAALERSGESLVRAAVQKLERQASDLERISAVLASHNKSAFHRKDQDFRMWMAGLVGVFVGIFLILLLPRFLPFSVDSRVASFVMGQDRINAAYAMINSVDPQGVKKMEWGAGFYDASGGEISACLEKARQSGKDQKCTITVPAPE
ncbi:MULTISPECIES: DUF6118 family protein [Brucella/Ochrobactrum group]|uniref:DUF6118 family protein n=1 Tax=Ochrobactrum sp. AP1BH01-1 TaxID=2823874 RepID=UPI001B392990|nr:DUF6118 family protein [Ochrobactrum sp. AP1BH01-1]MBQ0711312.1 hypothetical protein [Ochrobactrum sp. AP1BH01-1]